MLIGMLLWTGVVPAGIGWNTEEAYAATTGPTDLLISNSTIKEDLAVSLKVADLTAVDPDLGETFTFQLVSGAGDQDNAAFEVRNGTASSAATLHLKKKQNATVKSALSIRLRVTGSDEQSFEKSFDLQVQDMNEYILAGETHQSYVAASNALAPNLTIATNLAPVTATTSINGATVFVGDNFESGKDTLSYSGTLPSGVSASFDSGRGVLRFSGSTTPAQWQSLLRTVRLTTSSTSGKKRLVYFTIGTALPMQTVKETKYYEAIQAKLKWNEARDAAAARQTAGLLTGYLATVQSATEQDFLARALNVNGWLGGSDDFATINSAQGKTTANGFANQAASEGKYYWVTGPALERNAQIGAINQYANWKSGEPNNTGSSEHYIEFTAGGWQDRKADDIRYEKTSDLGCGFAWLSPCYGNVNYNPDHYYVEYDAGNVSLTTAVEVGAEIAPGVPKIDVGSYIVFGKYKNQPIKWRVINVDEQGTPLLFSELILDHRIFDVPRAHGQQFLNARDTYGSSYYPESNIRQWLNSAQANTENDAIDWIRYNPGEVYPYSEGSKDKGFLANGNFTPGERHLIKPLTHKVLVDRFYDENKKDGGTEKFQTDYRIDNAVGNFDRAYYKNVTDGVFLLSIKQLKEYVYDRGWEHRATVPPSELNCWGSNGGGVDFCAYWLNNVYNNDWQTNQLQYITREGDVNFQSPYIWLGIRPALQLNWPTVIVNSGGTGTSGNPFIVSGAGTSAVDMLPPTTPRRLVAKDIVARSFNLSWNAAADDAGVSKYEIYRDGTLVGTIDAFVNNLPVTNTSVTGLQPDMSYSMTVKAIDTSGNPSEMSEPLIVSTKRTPTELVLSKSYLAQLEPVNTVIGTLTTTDPDPSDTFTYALVSGEGSTDNALFNLNGNTLRTAAVLSFANKQSYSIRLRTTDSYGLYTERVFTIGLHNVIKKTSLKIGDYVMFGNYNDAPIAWRVINLDAQGNPLLFSEKILATRGYDSMGGFHAGAPDDRDDHGSNYYPDSNLRQWLNSSQSNTTGDLIDWIQNDPGPYNMFNGYNNEKGFLANDNFSAQERSYIMPYTHKVILDSADKSKANGGTTDLVYNEDIANAVQNSDTTAYYRNVTDQVLLLSVKQLKEYVYDRGWSIFTQPTVEAVKKHPYGIDSSAGPMNAEQSWTYFLSTPGSSNNGATVRIVAKKNTNWSSGTASGVKNLTSNFARIDWHGVRPAVQLNLANTYFLNAGSGSKDAPHVVSRHDLTIADTEKPSVISNARMADATATSIKLRWSAAKDNLGIKEYVIRRNANDPVSGQTQTFTYNVPAWSGETLPDVTYEVTGLSPGKSYSFTIQTVDWTGNLSASVAQASGTTRIAPTIEKLTPSLIDEKMPINSSLATFKTTPDSAPYVNSYALVSGTGDTDNSKFTIANGQLRNLVALDADVQKTFAIRVKVTNNYGLSDEKPLIFRLANINEESPIKTGQYVRFGSYLNQSITWRVIHTDEQNNSILFAEDILTLKAFDASRSNNYATSNIRQWLNSTQSNTAGDLINWLTTPPVAGNLLEGHNPYASEKGFLANGNFSVLERALIRPRTHKVLLSKGFAAQKEGGSETHKPIPSYTFGDPDYVNHLGNYDTTAFYKNVTDHVFLLSSKDIKEYLIDRGFPPLASPTDAAVAQSTYADEWIVNSGTELEYWLNNPETESTQDSSVYVSTLNVTNANEGTVGVRPALQLNLACAPFTSTATGLGTETNPFVIRSISTSPTPPCELKATNVAPNSLTLAWQASMDDVAVVNYKVESDGVVLKQTTSTTTELTGLKADTVYNLKVTAFDAVNNSTSSRVLTVRTVDNIPPAAPSTLFTKSRTFTQITIDWAEPASLDGVTGYKVYLNGVLAGETTNTEFTFTGLTQATAYQVKVQALDAAGNVSADALLSTNTSGGPIDILLSNTLVAENRAVNTVVGTLSTVTDTLTSGLVYTLVSGAGDSDNSKFNMNNNELRTSQVFDFETKNSYSVRVRVTDPNGMKTEKAFTLSIRDVSEGMGNVNIGEYIAFGKYNNQPILWRVINKDSDGNPLLFAERILTLKPFDKEGNYHSTEHRKANGSNYYHDSNIRQWLNSASANSGNDVIDWIQNDFTTEKGFLADGNFSATERAMIKPLRHKVALSADDRVYADGGTSHFMSNTDINQVVQNYDTTAWHKFATDKVLLLSVKQLKEFVHDRGWSYMAKPTMQAVANSAYTTPSLNSQLDWQYALNSPCYAGPACFRLVLQDGKIADTSVIARSTAIGIRPALQLDAKSLVFGDGFGTETNPYTIDVSGVPPQDIALSHTSFSDQSPSGSEIAQIRVQDPWPYDKFTMQLVSGAGSTDNASFSVSGAKLLTAANFAANSKTSYQIRLRATDEGGASIEKAFVLTLVKGVSRYVNASKASITSSAAKTAVDSGLSLTDHATLGNYDGATVLIGSNFDAGKDVLSFSGTLPSGITAEAFNSQTGLLRFKGTTTVANWQSLLRTVKFTTTSTLAAPRTVHFTLGNALPVPLANGAISYYEAVNSTKGWSEARDLAASRKMAGLLEGYLAVPADAAEQAFLKTHFNVTGWVGASDEALTVNEATNRNFASGFADQTAAEGKFHWVTGPLAGRIALPSGTAGWKAGEPNNSGSEHFLAWTTDGFVDRKENEYAGNLGHFSPPNYYVEYSDPSISLTASIIIEQKYTVTFNSNGGDTFSPQVLTVNSKVTAPTAPVRSGYTFAGWHSDSSLLTPYDFAAAVTDDLTLHAKWNTASGSIVVQDGYGFNGIITNPRPIGQPVMTAYQLPQNLLTSRMYVGGIYDGTNLWLIPAIAKKILKVNPQTGAMTQVDNWPSGFTMPSSTTQAFAGAVYDGENIWMVPNSADRVIKLNVATGQMTGFNQWPSGFTKGDNAFQGGIFDGKHVWLIPFRAQHVIKIDVATGVMTAQNNWPSGYTLSPSFNFAGGVYDGTNIWLIPTVTGGLIKLNVTTGTMTAVNSWPSGHTRSVYEFSGGTFDGTNIWLAPYTGTKVMKINPISHEMTAYDGWPSGFNLASYGSFAGAVYDGASVWLIPNGADQLIKMNPQTGAMSAFNNFPANFTRRGNDFYGATFDGNSLWLVPSFGHQLVKVSNGYEVTFESNGGSAVAAMQVVGGSLLTAPQAPTKTGLFIDAWYSDAALTQPYDFNVPVTANVTLYAKWTIGIDLSTSTVTENSALGTTIGSFTFTGLPEGVTATYSLVAGAGATDNSKFKISRATLQTNDVFDFEAKSTYSIRIRLTDSNGGIHEKSLLITVSNINEAPTNLAVSANEIDENKASGTVIGTLSATDPDSGDTFTYSLVIGEGDTDNASFTIVNGQLRAARSFDFENKFSYSIRVRVTDAGSLTYEEVVIITIKDRDENAKSIAIGDYIMFGSYHNAPILWRVIDLVDGNPMLFAHHVLTGKKYDASGAYHTDSLRKTYGSNYYPDSNIRQWINNAQQNVAGDLIDWTQNDADYNEKGFLADGNFLAAERAMIIPYTHQVVIPTTDQAKKDGGTTSYFGIGAFSNILNGYSTAYYKSVTDSVFLPSVKMLKELVVDRGWDVKATPTKGAVDRKSIFSSMSVGAPTDYWTNTSYGPSTFQHLTVTSTGSTTINIVGNFVSDYGVRPALVLDFAKANIVGEGNGSFDTPFWVEGSASALNVPDTEAPSTPSYAFTTQVTKDSAVLYWAVSTDNVGVTSYEIYSGDQLLKSVPPPTNNFPNMNTTITGLTPGTNYTFTVKAKDKAGNLSGEVTATATTLPDEANVAPTDILLSTDKISENSPNGSIVGTMFASDANAADTATFTLVSGEGDADNGQFTVQNFGTMARLLTNATFDFETKSSYNIRVRVTDKAGATFEKTFVIIVEDLDEQAPTIPTGLVSANVTANAFNLSWNASSDNVAVASYEVYLGSFLVGTSVTTSLSVTGLASVSVNSMTVVAVDTAGNRSATSSPLTVTTLDNLAPTIPGNLRSSVITSSSFQVNWNASTDNVAVSKYNIYRNGAYVATLGGTTLSYVFSGLAPDTNYAITVLAMDAANNRSAQSVALQVRTTAPSTDTIAPTVPSGLAVSNLRGTSLTLTWTASTDNVAVKNYNIYLNGRYVTSSTTASVNVTGLTSMTSYDITVLASDTSNNRSSVSTALRVTTPDGTAPTVPTNVTISNQTLAGFTVTWTASTDNVAVTKYNIYRNGAYIATINAPTSTYTFANLLANTTYQITVLAMDAAGNRSAQTAAVSGTTLAGTDTLAPTAPTNLLSSNITTSGFTITWTAATDNVGVSGYNIYRNGTYVTTVSGTTTSYTFSGLSAGLTHNVYVRALDAAKNFTNSTTRSVTTLAAGDATPPTAPTGLVSSNVSKTGFRIAWTAATDNVAVANYNIYRNGAYVATVGGGTLNYTFSGLAAGTTYSITVRALDAAKNFTNSTALSVTTLN